jgi:hypothetical protein
MSVCANIAGGLGELFQCSEVNGRTRVRTPFLYPDGDVIDLFFEEKAGVASVSDLGETLRWLRNQSISTRRSPKQNKLIEDVCLNHGIELYRGMLVSRLKPGEDLSSTFVRVAQAALRVADLWFTLRTRSVETVTDEVEVFLQEKRVSFERGESLVGRSGRTWKVDFHTRTPARSSLVYVLSTGSRASARSVANQVLAAWYDLNNLKVAAEGMQFVSLFDDTMDVWATEDFKLVEDLSQIARWSKPDEVADLLAA